MVRRGNEGIFTDLYRLIPLCTSPGGSKTTGATLMAIPLQINGKALENELIGNTDHRSTGTV